MRKFYCAFLLISTFVFIEKTCNAQNLIPNPSFETWLSSTRVKDWNTISLLGFNLVDINKVTDAKKGDFAAQITSKKAPEITGYNMVIPGILLTGDFNVSAILELLSDTTLSFLDSNAIGTLSSLLTNGVSISRAPTLLEGYYKYSPAGADDYCAIGMLLYSSVSGTRTPIGIGTYMDNATSTEYQHFTVPITYWVENITPDEMIVFAISSASINAQEGSSLIIDDFSTTSEIGIESVAFFEKSPVKVYPNPSKGSFVLDFPFAISPKVTIYNIAGKLVWSCESYTKGQLINLKDAGTYTVQIISEQGVKVQKITVR